MPPYWNQLLATTLAWLQEGTTWPSVVLPALLSVVFIARAPLRLMEIFAVLAGIAATWGTSHLMEVDGALQLHATPVFTSVLVALVGLRWYIPDPGKAFAMCWLVLVISDFGVMSSLSAEMPEVQLPRGIGGAGFGDALFFEPALLVLGLLLLKAAREYDWLQKAKKAAPPMASVPENPCGIPGSTKRFWP